MLILLAFTTIPRVLSLIWVVEEDRVRGFLNIEFVKLYQKDWDRPSDQFLDETNFVASRSFESKILISNA